MGANHERLETLFEKWLARQCSSDEVAELVDLLRREPKETLISPQMEELWTRVGAEERSYPVDWDQLYARITSVPQEALARIPARRLYRMAPWAAVLVLVLGWTFWRLGAGPETPDATQGVATTQSIRPGSHKAILTLGNGTTIRLNQVGSGELVKQGSTRIIKLDSGVLAYRSASISRNPEEFNTLTTPVGGQYELQLPDGTKVWLNAASSIRYPISFTGKQRQVRITGEVYFEVAADPEKPFVVATGSLQIRVLGTQFNINAYGDEKTVKTTLLEGSVRVSSLTGTHQSLVIAPGQQAELDSSGQITLVRQADTKEAVGWKNGLFVFHNDNLPEIMRQLVRWYDVDVEYADNEVPESHFSGAIYRKETIDKVLHMLELTGGAHFKIDGTKIIVSP